MRTAFIIVLFFLLSGLSQAFSQGNNLEFNDVKYITVSVIQTSTTVNDTNSILITIPANKVWKIENCGTTFIDADSCVYFYQGYCVAIGGVLILDKNIIFRWNSPDNYRMPGPIWLPSGNHTLKILARHYSLNMANVGDEFIGFISAIEFNIVP